MSGQRAWIFGLLLVGAALRIALFALSPVHNAYDDHLTPIALYATHLARPAADACWQCYQPPAYYALAAAVLHAGVAATGDNELGWRAVQLLSVIFSLALLAMAWRILKLAGARGFGPRACAFAVLVFLPREVYTAVFISNDAMLYFAVSLAVLVYLEAVWRDPGGEHPRWLVALLVAVALAAWTKQHGLIVAVLPVALVLWQRHPPRTAHVAAVALGLLVVASEELYKLAGTGHLLISNQHYFDWPSVQRPGSVADTAFFDLRFVTLLNEPTISNATIDSYWTQLFAKLWFDYDPKFLIDAPPSRTLATVWYVAGGAFTLVWLLGAWTALARWRRMPQYWALGAVQLAFLLVPLAQSLRFPYHSSMKATFFLPAVTISGLLLSFGFERLWERRALRVASLACCALLALAFAWELVLVREQIRDALLTSLRGSKLWPYPPGWGTR